MRSRVWAIAALASVGISSLALGDGLDVGIRNVGGRLSTLGVTGEPPTQVFGTEELRVFGVDLAFDALDSIVKAEEPGLASNDAGVLGRSLRVDILKAARAWDVANQTFASTTQTLSTGKAPAFSFFSTPAADVVTPTNTFVVSDDFHFDWVLSGATATTGTGIFLVELGLVDTSPTGALLPSAPYWLVFNYGLSEAEHEAAIDWVQATLVPAPGASAALLVLGLGAARRRR